MLTEADMSASVDDPIDLDHTDRPVLVDRQRWRSGRATAVAVEAREVVDGQVRADRLDPGTGDQQVDDVGVGPERDGDT